MAVAPKFYLSPALYKGKDDPGMSTTGMAGAALAAQDFTGDWDATDPLGW